MLPACKQQSVLLPTQFLPRANGSAFPRISKTVASHCALALHHASREGRHKNPSCCLLHPEGDYLEAFIYFQEETDSAEQSFQKLPVLTAGEYSLINTHQCCSKKRVIFTAGMFQFS